VSREETMIVSSFRRNKKLKSDDEIMIRRIQKIIFINITNISAFKIFTKIKNYKENKIS
jgi:hypothetical protein